MTTVITAAAASHLPVTKAMAAWWAAGRSTRWYRRTLEYSHTSLLENLADPVGLILCYNMASMTLCYDSLKMFDESLW